MHPQLQQQHELVKQAGKILDQIETVKVLVTPKDKVHALCIVEDLQNEYATVMRQLMENMVGVAMNICD